ncbi:MAG: ribonuclease P protein component [Flavobacteriaceae bacterium]|jgi:ribonuclease P protein component|nr:ribonuclease P protein component [Flavobacteriaceae bacterium]
MSQTFTKEERLVSKNLIEQLFTEGKQLKVFPFRLVYIKTVLQTKYPAQAALTTPKRLIKTAVHRNRIKRQMREAYRKNKQFLYNELSENYVFIITFIDSKEWKSTDLEVKMKTILEKFVNTVKENQQESLN